MAQRSCVFPQLSPRSLSGCPSGVVGHGLCTGQVKGQLRGDGGGAVGSTWRVPHRPPDDRRQSPTVWVATGNRGGNAGLISYAHMRRVKRRWWFVSRVCLRMTLKKVDFLAAHVVHLLQSEENYWGRPVIRCGLISAGFLQLSQRVMTDGSFRSVSEFFSTLNSI